jgi:hypothetical protein
MRNLQLVFFLAASLLPVATTQAAPADLPETGQTTCYDVGGSTIACTSSGQDGDLKAGMAWPTARFVAGPTADCVTDTLTGLVWVRAPVYASYTWTEALTYANDLNLCGFTDWRLPNINELKSLVNSEVPILATFLNAQGFSGVQAAPYWSSTSHAAVPTVSAWYISMSDGRMDGGSKDGSSGVGFALPVRAGQ